MDPAMHPMAETTGLYRAELGFRPDSSVLVLGGYGIRNTGDEAILAGLLTRLGRDRVTVISRDPAETSRMHGVRAIPMSRALPELRRHDALLIGGGGLFSKDMGVFGQLIPAFGLFAGRLGLRVSIEGAGVDAATPMLVRTTLPLLARRCTTVRVRDLESANLLKEQGVDSVVAPDLSSFMPASDPPAEFMRFRDAAAGRPIVGLCLNAVRPELTGRLASVIPEVVNALPDVEFCFIPMSQHPAVSSQNDLEFAARLTRSAPRLRVVEGWHRPEALLGMFPYLSAAICLRFHSLLFARRAGIPIVAYPYAAKAARWLQEEGIKPVELSAEGIATALERCREPVAS